MEVFSAAFRSGDGFYASLWVVSMNALLRVRRDEMVCSLDMEE